MDGIRIHTNSFTKSDANHYITHLKIKSRPLPIIPDFSAKPVGSGSWNTIGLSIDALPYGIALAIGRALEKLAPRVDNTSIHREGGKLAPGVGIEPTHKDLESSSPALEHSRVLCVLCHITHKIFLPTWPKSNRWFHIMGKCNDSFRLFLLVKAYIYQTNFINWCSRWDSNPRWMLIYGLKVRWFRPLTYGCI